MKTLELTTLLAAAVLVCSCQKEMAGNESPVGEGGSLTIKTCFDDTKVALGEKTETSYPLTWSEGDYIVLDGVKSNVLTASQAGTKFASFTFEGVFNPPYNVIYGGKEGSADIAVFPATQPYTEGTFAPFSAPLYGTGSNVGAITVRSLNSVLRIPFKQGSASVKKILVEAIGGETLSGEFTLGKTSGSYDGTMTAPENGKSIVTLDCGEGVSLADGEVPFYISIPAGSYSKGLKVYAIGSDNKAMLLTAGSLTTAIAGKVYEFPSREFAPGDTYVIATVDDMDILPLLVDNAGKGKEVILIDDIDMTGKAWTSFGSAATVTDPGNFSASLDGKGHTIKGLTTPLFGNFGGKLKNITVEANIDWKDFPTTYKGSTYGLGIIAGYATIASPYGTDVILDNVTTQGSLKMSTKTFTWNIQFGGLVGANNGATIINCTNKANIDISAPISISKSGYCTVGGICGVSQGQANVTQKNNFYNNTNEGTITCSSALSGIITYYAVGGVIGRMTTNIPSGVKITKLKNKGKVSVSSVSGQTTGSGACYVAGVCGTYECTNEAADFSNEAEVHTAISHGYYDSVNKTGTGGNYAGGIVGRNLSGKITNFTNTGKLFIDEGFKYHYSSIGGVVAHIKGASTYDNLVNSGDIIFNASTQSVSTSHLRLGGVLGQIEGISSLTLKNSSNSGNININNGNSTSGGAVGGIAGNVKATTFTGTDNVNTGNITYNGYNTGGMHLAGLYARIENNAANNTITISGVSGKTTNSGKISLIEDGKCSSKPAAGGIIGTLYGSSSGIMNLTVSDCSNAGEIYRKINNSTEKIYGSSSTYDNYCGGIAGNLSSYVGGTVTNCSNSATIQFSKNDGTSSGINNTSQTIGYVGGIAGRISADKYLTIKNCRNTGNIPSVEGYCGGIAGYILNGAITGEKGNYCTNSGNVAYREGVNNYPQTTAGGILGGGSTGVTIEWCYNTGNVAGNGGISGFVGRVNDINAEMTIKHCKSFCKLNCVSTWAKSGFVCGYTSQQEDPEKLLKNMSDIATGGQYRYTQSGAYSTPTADNYVLHLYYNKTTAPQAAQDKAKATAAIDVATATGKNITLWNGTSPISWE